MSEEDSRTLYVGNLVDKVTEGIIYELFLQAGPVEHVKIPRDKVSGRPKPYGFVCFKDGCSVPYAVYLLDNINLFGKSIKVQTRRNTQALPPIHGVGVHSLDPELEKETDSFNVSRISIDPTQCGNQHNYQAPQINSYTHPQYQVPMPWLTSSCNTNSYVSYNSGFQGFCLGTTPSIDTDSLNNFKNMHDDLYNDRRHKDVRSPNRDGNANYNYQHRERQQDDHRNRRHDSYDRYGRYSSRDHYRDKSHRDSSRHHHSHGWHSSSKY